MRSLPVFYVVVPRYWDKSAGIRALYGLCAELNAVGQTAFAVVRRGEPTAGMQAGFDAPPLTQAQADAHFEKGRTPIAIYPEAFSDIRPQGVSVYYLLNYLGVMGGPAQAPACDMLLAYSRNIRNATPGCRDVLYMPTADAGFWSPPPPGAPRRGACVYEGKYVELWNQALPPGFESALRITRIQSQAQTREELRDIFRASKRLHVFENTALATEAALCGCPVTCHFNPHFPELIAGRELGRNGFALEDTPAELRRAEMRVGRFRRDHARAARAFRPALHRFVHRARHLARRCVESEPFRVEFTE